MDRGGGLPSPNAPLVNQDFLFPSFAFPDLLSPISSVLSHSPRCSSSQGHPTSESVADEGRRSLGNHGYQTRAAVEETSRQSAEVDDDDITSEVETHSLMPER